MFPARLPFAAMTAACLAASASAGFDPGDSVAVTLSSGEMLKGRVITDPDDGLVIDNMLLGEVALDDARITSVALLEAPAETGRLEYAPNLVQPDEDDADVIDPDDFFDGWKGSVAAGLSGSEGNTETLNVYANAAGERDTDAMLTSFDASYFYSRNGSDVTENNFVLNGRNEWKIEDPWSVFVQGTYEFDDFTNWDSRVSLYGGVGYMFIDNDKTKLQGRLGLGVSREIGGSDNSFRPEGLIGYDFEHKFTERQSFVSAGDLYPDLEDFGAYRFVVTAEYRIVVDPEVNMSFKAGLRDTYDSTPEGQKRNDLNYYLALGFDF